MSINDTSRKRGFRLGPRTEIFTKVAFALLQAILSCVIYNYLDILDTHFKIPTAIKGLLSATIYFSMSLLSDYIISTLNKNSTYNLKCDEITGLQKKISELNDKIKLLDNEISTKDSTINDKNSTIRKIIKSLTAKFIDIQNKSDSEKIEILTQVIKIISINEDKLCSNTKCSVDIIKATKLDELLAVPTNEDSAKNTTASKSLENLPDYKR